MHICCFFVFVGTAMLQLQVILKTLNRGPSVFSLPLSDNLIGLNGAGVMDSMAEERGSGKASESQSSTHTDSWLVLRLKPLGHFLLVPYVNYSYSCRLSFFVSTLIAEVKFCKYQHSSKIHIQPFGEEKKENDNRSNAVTDCFAALSVTVCSPSIKLQTGCAGISNWKK